MGPGDRAERRNQTLLRAGLHALLTQDPDIEIVGEADNDNEGHPRRRTAGARSGDLSMPGISGLR